MVRPCGMCRNPEKVSLISEQYGGFRSHFKPVQGELWDETVDMNRVIDNKLASQTVDAGQAASLEQEQAYFLDQGARLTRIVGELDGLLEGALNEADTTRCEDNPDAPDVCPKLLCLNGIKGQAFELMIDLNNPDDPTLGNPDQIS
jgi:hypothetical protein